MALVCWVVVLCLSLYAIAIGLADLVYTAVGR